MSTLICHLWSFSLPLVRDLPVGQGAIRQRDGLLLELVDEQGATGWGEIVPLPGLHREFLTQAREQLEAVVRSVRGRTPCFLDPQPDIGAWLEQVTTTLGAGQDLLPSVQFGVDMALATYYAARAGQPLYRLLSDRSEQRLPVQALLTGTTQAVLVQAKARIQEGYRAFKLKLGRQDLADDIECVRFFCQQVGPDIVLRLDPNRAWTPAQATQFVTETRDCAWEYLEEPLLESKLLPQWVEQTGCPVALDESLGGWGAGDNISIAPPESSQPPDPRLTCAHTLILKPHVLGGWHATQQWIDWARQHQRQVVFSGCFGSGLGLVFLAQWAASLGQNSPVGLDTGRWLAHDLIPPWMQQGYVDMDYANQQLLCVDRTKLYPVL